MKLCIVGSEAANVVNGWIQKAGYIPVTKGYDYKVELVESETVKSVIIDGIDCELERKLVLQMELNGVPRFVLQRAGGVRSDRAVRIVYPKSMQEKVEKGVYQGLMLHVGNYATKRQHRVTKAARAARVAGILFILGLLANIAYPQERFPVVRFWDGLNIVNAGDLLNNAVRTNCVLGCGASTQYTSGQVLAGNLTGTVIIHRDSANNLWPASELTPFPVSIERGVIKQDNTFFMTGTHYFVPTGGILDDTATGALGEDNIGIARVTGARGSHVNLRNNAGTEVGTAANPLFVDGKGATVANSIAVRCVNAAGAAFESCAGGGGAGGGDGKILDGTAAGEADVMASAPAGSEEGLIVRNIPSGTQAVSGTFWQATQPVSGTFWQATQPVSITGGNFPDNEPFNVNQWGGAVIGAAATLTDNFANPTPAQVGSFAMVWDGANWDRDTGARTITGTLPAFAATPTMNVGTFPDNEPFNLAQVAGTNTVNGGLAGSLAVGGTGANNAAITQNPVLVGVETLTAQASPTLATAGNLRRLGANTEGTIFTQEGGPNKFSCFLQAVTVTTQCLAAPAAGLRAYVTSFNASNQAATVQTLDVVYGTGAACVTGLTALTHKFQFGTNALTTSPFAVTATFDTPLVPAAASAICVRPSAATAFGVTITGFIAP